MSNLGETLHLQMLSPLFLQISTTWGHSVSGNLAADIKTKILHRCLPKEPIKIFVEQYLPLVLMMCWFPEIGPVMIPYIMMTSPNGNSFRVTGHLCGEFTGLRWIPAQRPVTRGFDVFFDLGPDKRLSKQSWGWWFETPSHSLWRHRNV